MLQIQIFVFSLRVLKFVYFFLVGASYIIHSKPRVSVENLLDQYCRILGLLQLKPTDVHNYIRVTIIL